MSHREPLSIARFVVCSTILLAGCIDDQINAPTAGSAQFTLFSAKAKDVPALEMDLPLEPRPWDSDPMALAKMLHAESGHAVIAFKSPNATRVLSHRGRRAVRSGATLNTIRQAFALLDSYGVQVIDYFESIGAAYVRIDPDVAVRLFDNPLIDYIEPRQWWRLFFVKPEGRPAFYLASGAQTVPWGISAIGATDSWSRSTGAGSSILIIDSGHARGHQDLVLIPESNCGGAPNGCSDGGIWHGTHVTGIATAMNNSLGVVGVAPGLGASKIFAWGACDPESGPPVQCSTSQVAAGINAGINWRVGVVSMSLGGSVDDAAVSNAVAAAEAADIVLVAAAGNHCHDVGCAPNFAPYPALYTKVLGVSGINSDYTFAHPGSWLFCGGSSSNYGVHVDLSAPFDALSTIGNNSYGRLCGTSMATPHVSGVIALVRAMLPSFTALYIWERLFGTADDRGPAGWDQEFGEGVINAWRATGPHVSIEGPNPIPPGMQCEWSVAPPLGAPSIGGYGALTYSWYKDGVLVGTANTYSASASQSFRLEVVVTDGQNVQRNAQLFIVVDSTGECNAR